MRAPERRWLVVECAPPPTTPLSPVPRTPPPPPPVPPPWAAGPALAGGPAYAPGGRQGPGGGPPGLADSHHAAGVCAGVVVGVGIGVGSHTALESPCCCALFPHPCAINRAQGKDKPTFCPNRDDGDVVVVVNADQVEFTGRKWEGKVYRWHTGYPGGLKERTAKQQFERQPEWVLREAVLGMLPKNNLRRVRRCCALALLHACCLVGSERGFQGGRRLVAASPPVPDPCFVVVSAILPCFPMNHMSYSVTHLSAHPPHCPAVHGS